MGQIEFDLSNGKHFDTKFPNETLLLSQRVALAESIAKREQSTIVSFTFKE